jgi:hypothetical protein
VNDVPTWTAIATAATAFFTLVLAAATAYLALKTGGMVEEMKASRLAQERPLVKVSVDRSRQYMLWLVVENVGRTPALNLGFDFSAPLVHPGFSHPERDAPDEGPRDAVLSEEVSFFAKGLNFLAPNDDVSVFWGGSDAIIANLRERGLARQGITVTVSYESVGGERYAGEEWTLNPAMHDEHIWLVLTTPEMVMDRAMELSNKVSSAIGRDGLKVVTADERRREAKRSRWRRPLGWTRRRWVKMSLKDWWRRVFGGEGSG